MWRTARRIVFQTNRTHDAEPGSHATPRRRRAEAE
jgi:hypothetical protein